MKIIALLLFLTLPMQFGFTLVYGPNEAKLPVTPQQPKIKFYWDGSAPTKIEKKEEFQGGQYADLDDKAFMEKLLQIAFSKWNNVPAAYIEMEVERRDGVITDSIDKLNTIVVEKSDNYATAAYAAPVLGEDGSTIEDCDIVIGDQSTEAKSLAFAITHEVGHCIGLGHNHTDYNALMGYSREDRSLKLGADDVAGAVFLYLDPAYEGVEKEFLGCATISLPAAAHSHLLLFLILLFPMVPALASAATKGLRRRN